MTHNELFSIYVMSFSIGYEPTMIEKRLFHSVLPFYDLCPEKWSSKRVGIFNDVANLIRLI